MLPNIMVQSEQFNNIFSNINIRRTILTYMNSDTLCGFYIGVLPVISDHLHKHICYETVMLLLKYPQQLDIGVVKQHINNIDDSKKRLLESNLDIYSQIKENEPNINTLLQVVNKIKPYTLSIEPPIKNASILTIIHGILTESQIAALGRVVKFATNEITFVYKCLNLAHDCHDTKVYIERMRAIVAHYGVPFIDAIHPVITVSIFNTYSPSEQGSYYYTLFNVLCKFFKKTASLVQNHLRHSREFIILNCG